MLARVSLHFDQEMQCIPYNPTNGALILGHLKTKGNGIRYATLLYLASK
jgi:hypothetical protein